MFSCGTDQALLLLAVPDAHGVLRFPTDPQGGLLQGFAGIVIPVAPLLPIAPQLLDKASEVIGRDIHLSCELYPEFADEVSLFAEEKITVFLAKLTHPEVKSPPEWPSLPEILRQMPRDRRRLPYMRAMQILTGALSLETKVVDVEEIAKHLTDLN